MMDLAVALAHELRLDPETAEQMRFSALLHDIGKIGVPDEVLRKPGKLTDEEWVIMRQHPLIGERILGPIRSLQGVATVVRHHHERHDGGGYPDGLEGDQIPLLARAIAVVDAYCTMTEDRPYRGARTHLEAVEELLACSGTQFDPEVVDTFLCTFDPPSTETEQSRARDSSEAARA
jgi:HD-GYP domain-containing protein (c-di-GMP phosphodiesterase class II)